MNAPVTSAAGMNKQWVERRAKAVSRGVGMAAPAIAVRAENSEIWDVEGNRYVDFGGGIAVVNTGHRHPLVMKRVYEQLEKFTHTCAMVMPYTPFVELCEKLNAIAPMKGENKSALVTTGAEAVENAVICALHTGSSDISLHGGFIPYASRHGDEGKFCLQGEVRASPRSACAVPVEKKRVEDSIHPSSFVKCDVERQGSAIIN